MKRGLYFLLTVSLAACELPTAPVPENPYDPHHSGARLPTAPSDLTVIGAGPTSVTLQWTDNSSFESGFRIERLTTHVQPQYYGTTPVHYGVVGVVGADVTTFTDTGLTSDSTRHYRIVPLKDGIHGPPSDSITINYPYHYLLGPAAPDTRSVAFSPDGKLIAVSEQYGPLYLYDAASQDLVRTLPEQSTFTFSPDGAHLALGGDGVRIYRVSDGALVQTLSLPETHPSTNTARVLSFSPNCTYLATAGGVYGVRIWDWSRGEVVQSFGEVEHHHDYGHLFYLDQKRVLIGPYSEGLTVWNIESGNPLHTFASYGSYTQVVFDRASQQLAISEPDGITLWDVETGQPLRRIVKLDGYGYDAQFSFGAGGKLLALVTHLGKVEVFDLTGNAPPRRFAPTLPRFASFSVGGVALDPSGRRLVIGRYSAAHDDFAAAQVWRLDDAWQLQ